MKADAGNAKGASRITGEKRAPKSGTTGKKVNKSWLHDHINDPYVKQAKRDGYRARAAYK